MTYVMCVDTHTYVHTFMGKDRLDSDRLESDDSFENDRLILRIV